MRGAAAGRSSGLTYESWTCSILDRTTGACSRQAARVQQTVTTLRQNNSAPCITDDMG